MLFKTHLAVAVFVFLITFSFFDNIFVYGLFLIFSTLFVDIDSKKSFMGKLLIFRPLQLFFSHRGILHSVFVGIFLSLFLFVLSVDAGYGFLVGYLVHIFLDCLSLSGVRLFWPFFRFKLKGFIETGGIFEDVIFVLFLLLDIFFVGKIFFNMLFSIT